MDLGTLKKLAGIDQVYSPVEEENPDATYLCEFFPYSYEGNGGGFYYPVPDNVNTNYSLTFQFETLYSSIRN